MRYIHANTEQRTRARIPLCFQPLANFNSLLSVAQKALAERLGLTPVPDMPGFHAEQTVIQGAAEMGLNSNERCYYKQRLFGAVRSLY